MLVVSEDAVAGLLDEDDAFAAVETIFAAMAADEARNFPVVREALGEGGTTASSPGSTGRAGSSA